MGVTFIAPQGTYTAPAKLVTKEITENGTYDATDDSANGYSSVTVNVEGGGGSSDFSTAEVTLVNSGETNMAVVIPVFYEADPPFSPNAYVTSVVNFLANETLVLNVPLYKGHCSIPKGISGDRISGDTVATSFTVTSGSATSSIGGVDITGDCTITLSVE